MNTIEQRTALRSSQLNAGLLRTMVDYSREAILVVNSTDLIILGANLKAGEMLGFLSEELIGRALTSVECSLLDIFFWDDLAQDPLCDGVRVAQTEWMRSNGSSFHVEKRISSYVENGYPYWIIYAEDLTLRKEVESHQLHLVSQLQSSLEATAEGILAVDLNGNIVNANRRFSLMWDWSESVMLEGKVNTLWERIIASLVDATGFIGILEKVGAEPHLETEDLLALNDGRYFICVSKPEFMRESLIGRVFSMRDVTATKRIETDLLAARDIAEKVSQSKTSMLEALKVSESRLRRLINSNLIGIMQGEDSGCISEVNDVLLGLLNLTRDELLQEELNWFQLTSIANHKLYENALVDLRKNGQSAPFEIELICKSRPPLPVMVGFAQLEGSTTEWVGFVLDLTRQRESDRLKSDFISLVSHELRTPLTSIQGSLGLLENGVCGEIPAVAMNLVKIALKNTKRLALLVNDLLDMEKLTTGKMVLNKERFDLVALTKQALEVNAGYAQTLNVSFQYEEHPEQAWCVCDSHRLMQVFANLLSNAVKFSKDGGCVEIKLLEGDKKFRVEIIDHGSGIPHEFREHIFKKFAQADGGDTRRQGGSGLGLNITQNLIEKMGGEMGFDSELGLGTTFWFAVEASAHRKKDVE